MSINKKRKETFGPTKKLDWVGPVDNIPFTDKLYHFLKYISDTRHANILSGGNIAKLYLELFIYASQRKIFQRKKSTFGDRKDIKLL